MFIVLAEQELLERIKPDDVGHHPAAVFPCVDPADEDLVNAAGFVQGQLYNPSAGPRRPSC